MIIRTLFFYLTGMPVVLLSALPSSVFAQGATIEFYSTDGRKTDEANSLYFRVGVKKNKVYVDSVFTYFTKPNSLRSIETRSEFGQIENYYYEYFENGDLKEKSFYKGGIRADTSWIYYPGARPNSVRVFTKSEKFDEFLPARLIHYWDSAGVQVVKNGDGTCGCYLESAGRYYLEQGMVRNGLKDGEWKGLSNDTLHYREIFAEGKLQKGVRFHQAKEIEYTKDMEMATYPGGLPELAKFLGKNLRYPAAARRSGISGKVFVAFVVRKTGELDSFEVVNDVPEVLSVEAMRVAQSMKRWNPGKMKGLPVHTRFVLPVNFKL